jgi:hypothetical protein
MKTDQVMPPHTQLSPNTSGASPQSFWKAVLLVTAIAGTLDIVAAHLQTWAGSGKFPTTMLKAIAGGALGRRAMQGGAGTMALGLFFHFFISFAFTLLFFLLYPRVTLLRKNRYAVGTAYALFTWAVMTYVVLPLSALPWRAPNFANKHLYIGWVIFTLIFGLPIVFGASRFYRQSETGRRH